MRGKVGRPRKRPGRVIADRGYDHAKYRRELRRRGIGSEIARRQTEHGSGLGRIRWVVARTFAWLHHFKRLLVRYDPPRDPRSLPRDRLLPRLLQKASELIVIRVLSTLRAVERDDLTLVVVCVTRHVCARGGILCEERPPAARLLSRPCLPAAPLTSQHDPQQITGEAPDRSRGETRCIGGAPVPYRQVPQTHPHPSMPGALSR
jgi:transposase